MICERCGFDHTRFEDLEPRYCIKCGERLIKKSEVKNEAATLCVTEVAALLGLTKGSVYQYVKRGIIPCFHVGRTLRFDARTINELRRC